MISASVFVIYKVYKGSKSKFAYALIAFTFLDGAIKLSFFLILVNVHPVFVDGQPNYFANFYVYQTVNYFYLLVSLQSWIFGMKYLESAMLCSLTSPCVSSQKVRYINWAGITTYSVVMLAMFMWCLITFPGYVKDNSFD